MQATGPRHPQMQVGSFVIARHNQEIEPMQIK